MLALFTQICSLCCRLAADLLMALMTRVLGSATPGADVYAQQLQKDMDEADRAVQVQGPGELPPGENAEAWAAAVGAAGSAAQVEAAVTPLLGGSLL